VKTIEKKVGGNFCKRKKIWLVLERNLAGKGKNNKKINKG
jgi:hypothetical protein